MWRACVPPHAIARQGASRMRPCLSWACPHLRFFQQLIQCSPSKMRMRADACAPARARRRKQRDSKKFSKQVMAEKKKEKAQSRKAAVADVSRLRRQRARQGYAGELDVDKELAAMARPSHAPGQRFRPGARPPAPAPRGRPGGCRRLACAAGALAVKARPQQHAVQAKAE